MDCYEENDKSCGNEIRNSPSGVSTQNVEFVQMQTAQVQRMKKNCAVFIVE